MELSLMELSLKDRLILSNQFKILEKLYPEESDYYAIHRKAVENGYSFHYSWMVESFDEEMSSEECQEVIEILDMYRAIHDSRKNFPASDSLDKESWSVFRGFDGNNESRQYSYVCYFMIDLDRFKELRYGQECHDLNSHMPTLDKYRKMLKMWKSKDKPYLMDINTVLEIVGA